MTDEQETQSAIGPWLPVFGAVWVLVFTVYFFSLQIPDAQGEVYRVDLWDLLPQMILDGLFPKSSRDAPSGWMYLSERLPLIFVAGVVVSAGCATGRLVLRGLSLLQNCDRPARWALSAGIGLSVISLFTLGCGLAGLLNREIIGAVYLSLLLAECVVSFRESRARCSAVCPRSEVFERKNVFRRVAEWSNVFASCSSQRRAVTSSTVLPSGDSPTWLKIPFAITMIVFLGPMILGALLPSTDFDVNEYHFEGPKEYYQNGQITFLPHNIYTSFPFLTEMLTLTGMVLKGDWWQGALAGKLVLMTFAPITALAIFSLTKQLSGETAAWLASLFYLSTPWVHRISIIAYTEGAMCAYVILTLLALFQFCDKFREPEGWKAILLIGFVSGSAASTKYPGLVFVTIPTGGLLIWSLFGPHRSNEIVVAQRLAKLGAFAGGVLIAFGPWLLKNLIETGNPVYPLAYSLFGGFDLSDELHAKWARGHASPPGRFTDIVMFRNRLLDVMALSSWQSPFLFAFAPCAFLVDPSRRKDMTFLAGCVLFLFLGWYGFTHHIDRFWLHLIPVTAVLAGTGFVQLMISIQQKGEQLEGSSRLGVLLILFCQPIILVMCMAYNWAFATSGLCGPNGYLLKLDAARKLYVGQYSAITTAERELPPDGCVLFVGEAAVFEATFPVRYSTVFDVELLEQACVDQTRKTAENPYPLLSRDQILQNLEELGVTHVFVNWDEVLRYRAPGSYGFTDFVSPKRMQELVQMGVLEEVSLPLESAYRPWEGKDPALQKEILNWGPELRQTLAGTDVYRCYEMYRLAR